MIAELDSDKGKREVVSYFELQNADPQDVYQNLQDLFNRSTVRMQNNNNQNSFLGRNHPLTQRETQNQQGYHRSPDHLRKFVYDLRGRPLRPIILL
jgi:hypothetical protein